MNRGGAINTSELLVAGERFCGQYQARDFFSRILGNGRLAHAYLFRGPEGVGKKMFAAALGAALNCRQREGLSACGGCASCGKLAAGSHPDYITIAPEKGAIKIDQIRELIKGLSFAPYEAKTRVVLIEDVHTMRQEAANSLLKTLEEPPGKNLLILTADSSGQVLRTILSRCQVIPFYPLTLADTAEILQRQDPDLAPAKASLLAGMAEGSPGRAQLFLGRGLLELWEELQGLLLGEEQGAVADLGGLLLMAEVMGALKEDLPRFFSLIRLWIRDCLYEISGLGPPLGIKGRRKDWNSVQYFAKLEAINQAEKELGRNCNRTLVCEVLLFRLKA